VKTANLGIHPMNFAKPKTNQENGVPHVAYLNN
jgi:hypothetical protein